MKITSPKYIEETVFYEDIDMYLCHVHLGKLTVSEQNRRKRIARKYGIDWVYDNFPVEGWKSWFACKNRGEPFDIDMANTIMDELSISN